MSTPLKRRHEDSAFPATPVASHEPQPRVAKLAPVSIQGSSSMDAEGDRVHSPNNIMDAHSVIMPPSRESKRALTFTPKREEQKRAEEAMEDDPAAEKRVTIWNWREQRKLSGNSAPFKKNLKEYIRKHPDWEEYLGQDKDEMTGKKLTFKKTKVPQPLDPNHPWYTMQRTGMMPPSPAASCASSRESTSTYGTRSRESRLQAVEGRPLYRSSPFRHDRHPPASQLFARETLTLEEDSTLPLEIYMEPPNAIIRRRKLEVFARREAISYQIGPSKEEQIEARAEADRLAEEEAERKAAWDAASAVVAQLAAEKAAEAERVAAAQRALDSEKQAVVVSGAMARIMAYKKQRRI